MESDIVTVFKLHGLYQVEPSPELEHDMWQKVASYLRKHGKFDGEYTVMTSDDWKGFQEIIPEIKQEIVEWREKIGKQKEKRMTDDRPEEDQKSVYLMRAGGRYKIGQSKNPHLRMESIQTSSPYHVSLLEHEKTPKAEMIEQTLHKIFDGQRVQGEWFEFDDSTVHTLRSTGLVEYACQAKLYSMTEENLGWRGGAVLG